MTPRLFLQILDGPQLGSEVEVLGRRASVGGRGSNADIEIPLLPSSVKMLEFGTDGRNWQVAEFQAGAARHNDRELKRRNRLVTGDIVAVASEARGKVFRIQIRLQIDKPAKSPLKLPAIKPIYAILGAVYILGFVVFGLYLMANESGPEASMNAAEIEAALDTDLDVARQDTIPLGNIVIDSDPIDYQTYRALLNSDLSDARKAEVTNNFRDQILQLYTKAWAFEQRQRWDDAAGTYRLIVEKMGQRDLTTTQIALVRLIRAEKLGN